jgi:hypothetical protein
MHIVYKLADHEFRDDNSEFLVVVVLFEINNRAKSQFLQ